MESRNEGLGTVGTAVRKVLAGTGGRPGSEVMKLNSQRQDYGRNNGRSTQGTGKRGMVVMRR